MIFVTELQPVTRLHDDDFTRRHQFQETFSVRRASLKASCGCDVNHDLQNIQTPTGKILMESDSCLKDFAKQTNMKWVWLVYLHSS